MHQAKLGDRVRVGYLGLLGDGTAVGRDRGRRVLEFTVGGKEVVSGISFGVVGMVEGQEKRLTLAPEEAYGPVRAKLVREVARQRFPSGLGLHVGQRLASTRAGSARRRQVKVVELRPETVVLDGNHPLAGKVIEVELHLISLHSPAAGAEPGETL